MRKTTIALSCLLAMSTATQAQNDSSNKVSVNGSVQSDILIPQEDESIGTGE